MTAEPTGTQQQAGPRYDRRYAQMRAVDAFPGVVRRTLGSGASLTLVEIQIALGHEVPEHVHPHEQAGTVRARITHGYYNQPGVLREVAGALIPALEMEP